MELIPEYCMFISDSYVILISVLAHTMGCHKAQPFMKTTSYMYYPITDISFHYLH